VLCVLFKCSVVFDGADPLFGFHLLSTSGLLPAFSIQGALPGTSQDFWRMIWEQKVQAIIMLTKCEVTNDKRKFKELSRNDLTTINSLEKISKIRIKKILKIRLD
jgi:hypothetical protein